MHCRRSPRFFAFDIYRLPPKDREAAYAAVPADILEPVRYYVEVYFPPLEGFKRNALKARAERSARERAHAARDH